MKKWKRIGLSFATVIFCKMLAFQLYAQAVKDPAPVLPVPTEAQLKWK